MLIERNCPLRIPLAEKISSKNEGDIKTYPDEGNLKEFITKLTLKNWLKKFTEQNRNDKRRNLSTLGREIAEVKYEQKQ